MPVRFKLATTRGSLARNASITAEVGFNLLNVTIEQKRFARRNADRSFSGFLAIADLRLTVAAEEFVCLVGPSGCGKSTLLNIINGLDADFDGKVQFVREEPQSRNAVIATMFQSPRLMPWLTVLENVLLVLDDSSPARARADALLNEMGLGDFFHAFPNQLSGGMQRRVALARAFAVDPTLLLMDEPFVSLDAPTATLLRDMLISTWQLRRAGVLFVTHDLNEALGLADRIVFLSGAPARVVLEWPISTKRPRDFESVMRLRTRILDEHPELLAGMAADESPGGGE